MWNRTSVWTPLAISTVTDLSEYILIMHKKFKDAIQHCYMGLQSSLPHLGILSRQKKL